MKYGLIGCGRIAKNHVKAVINNNIEFIAACDLVPDKIDLLFESTNYINKDNVEKYTDYKKMIIDHPELELVSIATDSGVHAEIALYCIENHINVIIEKPIAMSIPDADLIIKKANEYNVKVSACHQNRFNIAVQKMRQALEKGRFGALSHGSIHVRWNRNKAYYEQAPWRGKWASDGGALMNQCIHGIDLLRWMMGDEIDEVYGVTRQQFHDYLECEDVGMAVVKFKNGSIGTIEGTVNVYPKNLEETLYVFGENGTVKLGGTSCNNIDVWSFSEEIDGDKDLAGLQEETSNVYGNGHTSLFADMIDAIENNREPYVNAVSGRNALEVVLAIYKSQLTGEPVKLPLTDFASIEMKGMFGEGSL
ncbi:MAG: Gfo/Idh/MocA family oxidoreductase [Pseudobutyrivibrio sp.]|nr:Gfo/Idh/MocA family oxidoreductase [Pseudobutyrivibrio sp.]